MTEMDDFNEEQQTRRPGFLTTLCVLSFVWLGFAVLSGITSFASGPSSEEELTDLKVQMAQSKSQLRDQGMDGLEHMMDQLEGMTLDVNDHFYLASSLNLLITLLGLFAVFRMMKGFRIGFHLYIVYNLVSVGALYAYVNPAHIPTFIVIFNLFFSALFIFLYSRNLHWMTK